MAKYKACICEGGAERAILELLLEQDKLIFSKEELLEEEIINSRWANDEMLHTTTNYECYKGLYSSHNDRNYFEIAHSFRRQFEKGGIYEKLCLYNFVDNHDVNRLASVIKNPEHIYNIYTLLYTMPGIPSVYYGSEYGIV